MQYTHQSPKYLLGLRAISNTASTAMLCNFNYIEKGKIVLFGSKIENRIFSDLIKTRLKNNSIEKTAILILSLSDMKYTLLPSSLSLFFFFPLCVHHFWNNFFFFFSKIKSLFLFKYIEINDAHFSK